MNYGTDLYDFYPNTFKADCFVTLLCGANNMISKPYTQTTHPGHRKLGLFLGGLGVGDQKMYGITTTS